MGLDYVGYFNPATAALPHAPLLVVLLLPTLIWLGVWLFHVKRLTILSAICVAYGLYALLVAHGHLRILDWRSAALHPEDYPVAEGRVTDYRQKMYLPAKCTGPVPGIVDTVIESDDVEQRFTVAGEAFIAHHQRRPIVDFFIPRLYMRQLPLKNDARVRITYRLTPIGKEFLNVQIETNDVGTFWCTDFPIPDLSEIIDPKIKY